MIRLKAPVLENRELGPGLYSLWLAIEGLNEVQPGQFFEFRIRERFLRRALSIADQKGRNLRFVLKTVGSGTQWLAQVRVGEMLDLIGPCGQGVKIPDQGPVMLLGGGVGSAPLLYLARRLSEKGIKNDAVIAACTRNELILVEEFKEVCREVIVSTDDGSSGHKGLLTEVVRTLHQTTQAKVLYACGPEPMLAALKNIGLKQPVYAFLESRMGCGMGLCVGCAVKGRDSRYHRVCLEGPVFDLTEIEL
ncbi:dihydroorotate dehydrogenase electron transfer subunit [candidate division WOR-3 bacterium]|nr:dihydroorotate dehydrogenase electron transfer subunit [candidate division WOR-3 bacterium]